jgi:hypothetical protein
MQRWKHSYSGGENKTPDHASVTAQKELTLADQSQEKLLKSTNCQMLLSCTVIGSYGPCANLPL